MSHWLEEAEQKLSTRSNKKTEVKERIISKKSDVKKNRELIGEDYLDVIDEFVSIIQRINNLPRNERVPFGQIDSKHKENKLNNLLHKFSSSRRINVKEFSGIMSPFKSQRYKNSRSFFISISKEEQMVLLEYKEVKAKRVRLNDEPEGPLSFLNIFKKRKDTSSSHDVLDNVMTVPLKKFDSSHILEHIDWLAYKKDSEDFLTSTS